MVFTHVFQYFQAMEMVMDLLCGQIQWRYSEGSWFDKYGNHAGSGSSGSGGSGSSSSNSSSSSSSVNEEVVAPRTQLFLQEGEENVDWLSVVTGGRQNKANSSSNKSSSKSNSSSGPPTKKQKMSEE